jgi:hypothetical protein
MNQFLTKHCLWLALLSCLLVCSQEAKATHAMGADLTYTCIGNNQYAVTLSFYRDCNGINIPNTASISWSGSCGSGTERITRSSITDITPICPGIVGSACNGGNGVFGIEQHIYTGVITLPGNCTNVEFGYRLCCRNNAITTLSPSSQAIYIESHLSNSTSCNNSPVFLNPPVPFTCVGQPFFYNHGAVDPDGDDLRFSLVDCYQDNNNPVTYGAGYSATSPLTTTNGVTIDPNTGAIELTPSIAQVGVLCVLVEEFRNGVLIGQVVRDIQFTVVPCNNNAPTASGVDGTTNYTASVQAGTQLCFNITSNDVDTGQNVFLTWNAAIAGATFTVAGAPFPTGTFCWTPTTADVGSQSFTVTVSDDACPVIGQNTYTYTVNVTAPPPPPACDSLTVTLVSSTDLACDSSDGTATIIASSGVAPYNYQVVNWTTGVFYNNTDGMFSGLPAGNYTIWVTDANGCTPSCTGQTFTIGGNVTPLFLSATAQNVDCPSNSVSVRDSNNLSGAINAAATGGTAPYLFSIDNGNTFQSSADFDFLAAGTYDVLVMDANGCTAMTTVTIGEPDPIQVSVVNLTAAVCGNTNGSVTLAASGGTPGFLYYIDGQSQSSPTFNNLAPGTYTFRVCDMNYCVYDTTITIPDSVVTLAVRATTTAIDCAGNTSGAIEASVNNGTAAFTYSIDGGATTQNNGSFSGLAAGTYTIEVTDANGCTGSTTVTITEPAPVQLTASNISAATCGQSDGSITLIAAGGTGNFTYTLGGGQAQNNATFNNLAPGTYNFTVTDANGCSQNANFTIPDVPGIVGFGSSTMPSCVGDCDGTATVEAADSSRSFTVLWNNGATTTTITDLCAGTYNATLTAANGCTDVVSVTVADPAPIDVTLVSTTDESCAGNDGSATVAASGGSAPYTFNLANFTTPGAASNSTGNFTGLNAGQYVVNVTDNNGCSATCATSFVLAGCTLGGGGDDDDDDNNGGGIILLRSNVVRTVPNLLEVNPNPASSFVQVRYQVAAKTVQLNVVSNAGKLVYSQTANTAEGSMEIPVNNWANSTYFVLLKDQNGKVLKSTKLVISK